MALQTKTINIGIYVFSFNHIFYNFNKKDTKSVILFYTNYTTLESKKIEIINNNKSKHNLLIYQVNLVNLFNNLYNTTCNSENCLLMVNSDAIVAFITTLNLPQYSDIYLCKYYKPIIKVLRSRFLSLNFRFFEF